MDFWKSFRFDNVAQRECGLSQEQRNTLEELDAACFTEVDSIQQLETPELSLFSDEVLKLLGGSNGSMQPTAEQLCGNDLPPGGSLAAHCYCGHQQGHFAGLLGDGAAVSMGEVVVNDDRFELSLEGCGKTPFTRPEIGVGRKTVGDALKEMLMSEALTTLRVPSTRSLAVVKGVDASDKTNPMSCGTVLRVAPSFLRFGSFQVALPTDSLSGRSSPFAKQPSIVRQLALHCMDHYFPNSLSIPMEEEEDDENLAMAPRFIAMLMEVVRRTARLVSCWQCLGAVHGMLNTDNLSILGLSLDHGCFKFMERTAMSFGGIGPRDMRMRYCYREQPSAALWACQRLAEAFLPLHCTPPAEMEKIVADTFNATFSEAYDEGMRCKLGLESSDLALLQSMLHLMEQTGADWTSTFRALTMADQPLDALEEISRWCDEGCETAKDQWRA